MEETYVELVPQIFLSIFIISSLIYYRFIITKAESINFTDLLWRVFITGLVTTIISLGIRLVFNLYENTSFIKNPLTINFFYHLYIALVVIFLISTFVVWKRLILYQKSKQLIRWWNAFEYLLVGALIYDFLGFKYLTIPFNIPFAILGIFSLVLSFNLKWIAYLNFKQKWKSILFILLSGIYLYHFVLNLSLYSDTDALIYDLFDRVFILALFVFIMIYAVIAILVTLFNLPTSSVFEKKLQEAVDFQKLSQSVPAGQSESETYDILLDGSMSAVFADAAWLEVKSDGSSHIITRNIREDEIPAIKAAVKDASLRQILDVAYSGRMIQKKVYTSLSKGPFRSVFVLPILVKNTQVGTLVLLQEVSDAFNREMVNIITTFVNQASVSLENTRLIGEALENERYKEQLKIAKNVQRSLLPEKLPFNDKIEIAAYSMAADEVGGDYYDVITTNNEDYQLIVGDVSGKGTSAAFNMAQMKGIFHSLAKQDIPAEDFIIRTNDALSSCLEKSSFITASYLKIATATREIQFIRAGHCSTLYYHAKKGKAEFLKTKGMGLGIVRNSQYANYVHCNAVKYTAGDIILLYTDGIVEAMDITGKIYGEDGLSNALHHQINENAKDLSPEKIKDGIIEDLYAFLNGKKLEDDYTLLIVKLT